MPRSHLLVVDADPQSLRVLEVSLRKAGFSVAGTHEGRVGLALLEQRPADVVLVDMRLGDMDGYTLVDAIRRGRSRDAAVILLASDPSVEARVRGLEHGVDDYVAKPLFVNEIVARVQLAIQRREHAALDREAERGKAPFAGALETTSLVDLLQLVEKGRRSGVLYVGSRGERGAIYFRDGVLVDAEIGALRGERAVHRALSWSHGVFEVDFREVRRRDVIHASVSAVLMEGMRRLDEWSHLLEALPGLDHVLAQDPEAVRARGGTLPPGLATTLSRFDGERSLAEVVYGGDDDELDHLAAASKLWGERLLVDTGRRARPTQVQARPPQDDRPTAPRTTWDYERPGDDRARDGGVAAPSVAPALDLAETTPGTIEAVGALVRKTMPGAAPSPLARARRMRRDRRRASSSDASAITHEDVGQTVPARPGVRRAPLAPTVEELRGSDPGGTTVPEIRTPPPGTLDAPATVVVEPAPPASATQPSASGTSPSSPKTTAVLVGGAVKTVGSSPSRASIAPLPRSPFPLAKEKERDAGSTRPERPRTRPGDAPSAAGPLPEELRTTAKAPPGAPGFGAAAPALAGPSSEARKQAPRPASGGTAERAADETVEKAIEKKASVAATPAPAPAPSTLKEIATPSPRARKPSAPAWSGEPAAPAGQESSHNVWDLAAGPDAETDEDARFLTVRPAQAARRALGWSIASAAVLVLAGIIYRFGGDSEVDGQDVRVTALAPEHEAASEPPAMPSVAAAPAPPEPPPVPVAPPEPVPAAPLPPPLAPDPSAAQRAAAPEALPAAEPAAAEPAAAEPAAAEPAPVEEPAATEPSAPSGESSVELSRTALGHLEAGRNKKAQRFAERAVAADPSNSEGWIVLGAARAALGDRSGARAAYERCVAEGRGSYVSECQRLLR